MAYAGRRQIMAGLAVTLALVGSPLAHSQNALYRRWSQQRLEKSRPQRLVGPFRCESVAFYVVHYGGPLTLTLTVNRPDAEMPDQGGIRFPHEIFWQAYDSDEHLIEQDAYRFEDDSERGKTFTVRLDEAPAGVYQIRVAKTAGNSMTFDLATEPACSFGIMPVRSRLALTADDQFGEAYV